MALTRKMLTGMGLAPEQVDSIIEAHGETVSALKDEIGGLKTEAEKLPGVQSELAALKEKGDGGYKDKFEKLEAEYKQYKADVEAKATTAAKETAARAYLESKGIKGKAVELALKAYAGEIKALELDGDKIKDATTLDGLVSGDLSGFVATSKTKGADVATPPAGGEKANLGEMSMADYIATRKKM